MINPPFMYDDKHWITVPPQGYGGIQWIIKNLIDGLSFLGHDITLIGAPGSFQNSSKVKSLNIATAKEINEYLYSVSDDVIIHDHSCRGIEFGEDFDFSKNERIIHSHYLISKPGCKKNIVAASYAHAEVIGFPNCPIIRHPVNPNNYSYSENKGDYLLYMGRVSSWKGTHVAAEFAKRCEKKLLIVGPAWEKDYYDYIKRNYYGTVEFCGEMGGTEKNSILSHAIATLVFSCGKHTPTGLDWVEPGSQIVSESAVSGTPVISTDNGCLKEIVPVVGTVVDDVFSLSHDQAEKILINLPSAKQVRENCIREWDYIKISKECEKLYDRINKGESW